MQVWYGRARSGDKKLAVNCHVGAQGSISAYQGSVSGPRGRDSREAGGEMHHRYLDERRLNSRAEISMESALCLIALPNRANPALSH